MPGLQMPSASVRLDPVAIWGAQTMPWALNGLQSHVVNRLKAQTWLNKLSRIGLPIVSGIDEHQYS